MQIEVPQWIKENRLTLTNFDQLRLTKNVFSVITSSNNIIVWQRFCEPSPDLSFLSMCVWLGTCINVLHKPFPAAMEIEMVAMATTVKSPDYKTSVDLWSDTIGME